MNDAKFATAAHLHVLLRRCCGRVTDTLWMVHNREYAVAMLRLAREQGDAELDKLVERFETLLQNEAPDSRQATPAEALPADYAASWEAKYKGGVR